MSVNNRVRVVGVGWMFEMVRATNLWGAAAAGRGDSGGPVISFWNRGVLGKGTLSAGSGPVGPCGLSSQCYRTVYYADLNRTLFNYGAALILG
jgi:hypothetical protein